VREGLREKLGPVLFQLPSCLAYSEERLARILNSLDSALRNVLEFRHPSWWTGEVYRALAARGVSFCGQSHLLLPDAAVRTTPVGYYRLHGVPDLYRSPYEDRVSAPARVCGQWPKRGVLRAFSPSS